MIAVWVILLGLAMGPVATTTGTAIALRAFPIRFIGASLE